MSLLTDLWPSDLSLSIVIFLILSAFVAGYIDSIAGGGGMVQALALLMAGIPPIILLATNKIISMCGTSMSVVNYARGKQIPWSIVLVCIVPCLIASAIGSQVVMYLSDEVISWLIILCIPVALLVMLLPRKKSSAAAADAVATPPRRLTAISFIVPIGLYDGMIGPGTGSYMALSAHRWLKMGLLRATGFAKPLNLSTNIGAAVVFIVSGKVLWSLAVPMIAANMLGAYIGSNSAMKQGDGFIKIVMVCVLVLMLGVNIVKLLID